MRILLILMFISHGIFAQQQKPVPQTDSTQSGARAVEFPADATWLNTPSPLSLKHFKGKFILLNFWTSSSALCSAQLKELKELQKNHRELEVIIVHCGKYDAERITENVRLTVIEHGIPFPVVNDSAFTLWRDYGVDAWPTNILINPDHTIVLKSEGASIKGDVGAHIELYSGNTQKGGSPISSEISRFQQGLLVFPKFIESDGHFSLFISEFRGHRIIQTDFNNTFEHFIGTGKEGFRDGEINSAQFSFPGGMAFHPLDSMLYIADTGNDVIRRYDLKKGIVTTILGNGGRSFEIPEMVVEKSHPLNQPTGLTLIGNDLYIAMTGWNQIWKLDTQSGMAVPVAGSGAFGFEDGKDLESVLAEPFGMTHDPDGTIYFTERQSGAIRTYNKGKVSTLTGAGVFDFGDVDGKPKTARLQGPAGIEYHNGALYVADQFNHKIKSIDPNNGRTATFLGSGQRGYQNGSENAMAFYHPSGLTVLRDQLFITDTYNQVVRRYDLNNGSISPYDFQNKDQMQFRAINEFQVLETDTILIAPGKSNLTLVFELDSLWKLVPDAPQSAVVITRNPAIIEDPDGINTYSQSINFTIDNTGAFQHFIADISLIYAHNSDLQLQYFRTFTLMVLLKTEDDAPADQTAIFEVPSIGKNSL